MKRLLCTTLILALLLSACGGAPLETTAPVETIEATEPVLPPETTNAPEPDNNMSYREEDLPIPDVPTETAAPVFQEYTHRIEDPEAMIYSAPGFVHEVTALVEEAGAYTIIEEATDRDGNLWGRLKSGLGWVCLTEPALAPIHADYAPEDFNGYHAYWSEETDYITSIGFTPTQTLTDVRFGLLDWFETESWQMSETLYTIDEMDPDHAFLAQVVFWGDMTTYGISFEDARGEDRFFAISVSGKDGSLICQEYLP